MLKNAFIRGGLSPCPPLTSFIGRRRDLDEIKKLLNTVRLVTLVGVGGCGKTRLASQIVLELSQGGKQEIWWVDLTALADPLQVSQEIGAALDIVKSTGDASSSALGVSLQSKKLLLVLDGCEQLVEACAVATEELLLTRPHLSILVTSRQALNIAGETTWLVPPLNLPDPDLLLPFEEILRYEAIQLFVERAMAALPSFELTSENMSMVVQVCRRLDGLPLAIELAAMRVKMLSLRQIAARLDDCWQLLTGGSRTALPRHQTLRATVDWSYNLLSQRERSLFRQLSVFDGGFSLEDVEAVCTESDIDEHDVIDLLSHLIDKSLVLVEERDGEAHYRLLGVIRQYSRDKLQELGAEEGVAKGNDWQRRGTSKRAELGVTMSLEQVVHPCTPRGKGIEVQDPPGLRILALGAATVYQDKRILTRTDWRYIKARELLFYLLCHPAETKDQIGLALWPDASPTQLRSSFHSALHHLRRALGRPDWIVFTNDRYSFNRQLLYWFDVEAFEAHVVQARDLRIREPEQAIYHLQEGVKLYQGDFLQSFFDSNWYLLRQKELQKIYLDAMITLGELFFARKQYAQAADTYQQIIDYDSFLEVAHRELIRCYVRQGERILALRHSQTLLTMLREEFGSLPAPETMALLESLRRNEDI